jgi:osmotically-inducible protein OsmY
MNRRHEQSGQSGYGSQRTQRPRDWDEDDNRMRGRSEYQYDDEFGSHASAQRYERDLPGQRTGSRGGFEDYEAGRPLNPRGPSGQHFGYGDYEAERSGARGSYEASYDASNRGAWRDNDFTGRAASGQGGYGRPSFQGSYGRASGWNDDPQGYGNYSQRGVNPRYSGSYASSTPSQGTMGYGYPSEAIGYGQQDMQGNRYGQVNYGQGYPQGGNQGNYSQGYSQGSYGQGNFGQNTYGQGLQGSQNYGQENMQRGSSYYGQQTGQGTGYGAQGRSSNELGYGGTRQGGYATPGATQRGMGSSGEFGELSRQRNFSGRGPKGYTRSDERLKEDISERLTDDPMIDASDINIEVREGKVTLTGQVDQRWMKHDIEDLVDRCSGVKDIDNRLTVSPTSRGVGGMSGAGTGSGQSSTSGSNFSSSGGGSSANYSSSEGDGGTSRSTSTGTSTTSTGSTKKN